MFSDDYQPTSGTTEAMWEALSGTKPKPAPKPKKPRIIQLKGGGVLNKDTPEYQQSLLAAQRAVPPMERWTFGEVQLFHNTPVKPPTPEYRLKLAWTSETDFEKLRDKTTRRMFCTERFVDLSTLRRFRENCNRLKRPLSSDDQIIATDLMAMAKEYNELRSEGMPEARLGFVGKRFAGEGMIRYDGQFVMVVWATHDDGAIAPGLLMTNTFQMPAGDYRQYVLDLAPPRSQTRKARASVGLHMHYSEAFRQHLVTLRSKVEAKRP